MKISVLPCILVFTGLVFATPAGERLHILVSPFQNAGDASHAWLSAGLTDSAIADLSSLNNVAVISDEDRRTAMRELELVMTGIVPEDGAARAGKMLGAHLVFTGSYTVAGPRVRIVTKLISVETGTVERSRKFDGSIEEIFDLEDRLVLGLVEDAGTLGVKNVIPVSVDTATEKRVRAGYRPAEGAYELYAQGRGKIETDPAGARALFSRAIEIDPSYADALMAAGFVAGSVLNRYDEGIALTRKALALLEKQGEESDEARAEALMGLGRISWRRGSYDDALGYFSRARALYETRGLADSEGYAKLLANTGNVYYAVGSKDEALEYYSRARRAWERSGRGETLPCAVFLMNAGNVYSVKGDHAKAMELFNHAREILERINLGRGDSYARLMMNMGIAVFKAGAGTKAALGYCAKAGKLWTELKLADTADFAYLLEQTATFRYLDGERDAARGDLVRAASIYRSLGRADKAAEIEKSAADIAQ
jgi:tetratricopeptide (TPR) repeat protein/TolB-like protein